MTIPVLDERMPYRTADTRDLLVVHRVIRRFARYLAAVTPTAPAGDLDAAAAVRRLTGEVVDVVGRLHAAQRDWLWPTLLGYLFAADVTSEDVLRIERGQDRIDVLLGDVARAADRFGLTADGADRDSLAALVARLHLDLDGQLADVERVALPLAEQYLTYDQWQLLSREVLRGLPAGRNVLQMGALLRASARRERTRFARRSGCRLGRVAVAATCRSFDREFAQLQAVLGRERVPV